MPFILRISRAWQVRENLNIVAFQCSRKQKRQNYGVQNNYIDSNAKIKGEDATVFKFSRAVICMNFSGSRNKGHVKKLVLQYVEYSNSSICTASPTVSRLRIPQTAGSVCQAELVCVGSQFHALGAAQRGSRDLEKDEAAAVDRCGWSRV